MKRLFSVFVACCSLLLLVPGTGHAVNYSGQIDQARLEIGRELIEMQSGNWITLMQYYAKDIEYHDPIVTVVGIETMFEFLARMFTSSPGLVTIIEDETCMNGIYTATWTMAGSFNEVPYEAKGMSIVKFRPGEIKAYYQRDYYTEGDIMINIPGLDEPALAFRTYYLCAVDPTFDCPFDDVSTEDLVEDLVQETGDLSGAGGFKLQQNVPNPFNPSTTISYDVPAGGGQVALRIYDISGKLVRTLVNGFEQSGTRTVNWNGTDDQGRTMASGVYYYQLNAPTFSEKKKMVLLR
jgi:hypothetical protein